MSEMRQLDARQQLLVILMEECGELIQECSKSLRKGELFDRQTFKDEVGDVYTMINLLHEWDVVSWSDIEEREQHKRNKLSRWSDLIGDSESRLYAEEQLQKGYDSGISMTDDSGWRKALDDDTKDEKGIGRVTYERVKEKNPKGDFGIDWNND